MTDPKKYVQLGEVITHATQAANACIATKIDNEIVAAGFMAVGIVLQQRCNTDKATFLRAVETAWDDNAAEKAKTTVRA